MHWTSAAKGAAAHAALQRSAPPIPIATPERRAVMPAAESGAMLRGFTRDGVIHILGGAKLPDGVFVKIIRE